MEALGESGSPLEVESEADARGEGWDSLEAGGKDKGLLEAGGKDEGCDTVGTKPPAAEEHWQMLTRPPTGNHWQILTMPPPKEQEQLSAMLLMGMTRQVSAGPLTLELGLWVGMVLRR